MRSSEGGDDVSLTPAALSGISVEEFAAAVAQAKAHYIEMPGLTLTLAQAARLWACDESLCNDVLSTLVDARFLVRTHKAAFALA
jgi:hypothetical protein